MKLQDKLAGWVKTGKGAIIFIHWESKVLARESITKHLSNCSLEV